MSFEVITADSVKERLKKLDKPVRNKILNKIKQLQNFPSREVSTSKLLYIH